MTDRVISIDADQAAGSRFPASVSDEIKQVAVGRGYLRRSVKEFGVKGDGSSGDAQKMVNALDSGEALYAPDGLYVVEGCGLQSTYNLEGAGKGKTIIQLAPGSADPVFYTKNNYDCGIGLSNLTIDGNKAHQSTALIGLDLDNTGTELEHIAHSPLGTNDPRHSIHDIEIINTKGSGMRVRGRGESLFARIDALLCDGHNYDIDSFDSKWLQITSGNPGLAGYYFRANASNLQLAAMASYYAGRLDRTTYGQAYLFDGCKNLVFGSVQAQNWGTTALHFRGGCSQIQMSAVNIEGPPDYYWINNSTADCIGILFDHANAINILGVAINDPGPLPSNTTGHYVPDDHVSMSYGVVFDGANGTNEQNTVVGTIGAVKPGNPLVTTRNGGYLANNECRINAQRVYTGRQPVFNPLISDGNGNTALEVGAGNANATDHLRVLNNIGGPYADIVGTSTDAGFSFVMKGQGTFGIYCPTGETPTLQALGADSNHDFALLGKGTGVAKANGKTAGDTIATPNNALMIHSQTSKTTPVDADEFALVDSEASNVLKRLTWANLKAAFKSYYDSVTTTLTGKTINLASNTLTGTLAQFNAAISNADIVPANATASAIYGTDGSGNNIVYGKSQTPGAFLLPQMDTNGALLVKHPNYATGSRPSASTVGVGVEIYDTTLSKPIWSNGTVWKDATGTTV